MSMEKKRLPGFKPLVTSLTIVGLLIAVAWCLQPASAQNPGLTSTKTSSPLPASNADLVSSKPAEYKVTNGTDHKRDCPHGRIESRAIDRN